MGKHVLSIVVLPHFVLQSIQLLLPDVALLGTLRPFEREPADVVHDSGVVLSWAHTMVVLMQRQFALHHRVAFARSRDVNFDCGLDGPTAAFDDSLLLADEAVLDMLRSVVAVPWARRRH